MNHYQFQDLSEGIEDYFEPDLWTGIFDLWFWADMWWLVLDYGCLLSVNGLWIWLLYLFVCWIFSKGSFCQLSFLLILIAFACSSININLSKGTSLTHSPGFFKSIFPWAKGHSLELNLHFLFKKDLHRFVLNICALLSWGSNIFSNFILSSSALSFSILSFSFFLIYRHIWLTSYLSRLLLRLTSSSSSEFWLPSSVYFLFISLFFSSIYFFLNCSCRSLYFCISSILYLSKGFKGSSTSDSVIIKQTETVFSAASSLLIEL